MLAKYKNKKYEIKGNKCILSDIRDKDAPHFVKWLRDPEVNEHIAMDFSHLTLQEEKKFFEDIRKSKNMLTFGVKDIKTKEVVGSISLKEIDLYNKRAVLGLAIANKKYWGMGIGTEATELLINFGFKIIGLNSISLIVHFKNKAAQKVYKKVGFKKAGVLKEHVMHRTGYDHAYIMQILKKDWKK